MKRGGAYRVAIVSGLTAIVTAVAACGGEGSAAARATVRDSAGVQVVENTAPAWSDAERWRLTDTPVVGIGVVEGDPHYQFDRVVGAIRLGDGRIVVANGGSNELRFYDAAGTYLLTSGRQGGGPGEFQSLRWLDVLPGDSLLAYDALGGRLSTFGPDGHFIRGRTLRQASGSRLSLFVGRFADGSIVMLQTSYNRPGGAFPDGRVRPPITYARIGSDGALLNTLGTFPGAEVFFKSTPTSIEVASFPLARGPSTAVYGNEFYYGSGDSYQIEIHALDGALRRIIRRAQENRPVTDAVVEQLIQSSLDKERQRQGTVSPASRVAIQKRFAEIGTPETMPAYRTFLLDAGGDLWVQEYDVIPDAQPPRWTVFDPTGQMLGTVTMPIRFTPLDIGSDYVLGRWQDDVDVEHVQLYTLMKPASPATVARRH